MLTMVKEKDRYMDAHVEEEKPLFSAVADYHNTIMFHGVVTTKTLG